MFKRRATALAITSLLSIGAFATESLEESRSTLNDQQGVAVTIYNQDLALVKDTRKVTIKTGLNALALRDVSAQMRPETEIGRAHV